MIDVYTSVVCLKMALSYTSNNVDHSYLNSAKLMCLKYIKHTADPSLITVSVVF